MVKRNILIVEDERIVAEDIKNNLQNLGYSVLAIASTGEEAIERTKSEHPDLVMMDIRLKGDMDGIECATHILSFADIPIVYLTAHKDERTLERAKITEPFGYVVKPFDISDLKIAVEMAIYKWRTEKILKDEEKWYSRTLWSFREAVIATDRNGLISFMNPAAESLTGCDLEDSVGEPILSVFNVISNETMDHIEDSFLKMNQDGFGRDYNDIIEIINRDGVRHLIERSHSPIKNDLGRFIGSVMVLRDVTAQKKREMELKGILEDLKSQIKRQNVELFQYEKLSSMGFMVAGVAHEINDPLTYIKSNTEFIRDTMAHLRRNHREGNIDMGFMMQMNTLLNKNLQAIDRIDGITKTLKNFVKPDIRERIPSNINQEIENVLQILKGQFKGLIELNQDYGNLPTLLCNTGQLKQVFLTIIIHISQTMRQGEMWIKTSSENGFIFIEIKGREKGVSENNMDKIYNPILLENKGNSKLNLGLCYSVIKEHKGEIEVENKNGRGTKITVKLPI